MIRTCIFDRFRMLRLPLAVISIAIVLLNTIWSPILSRVLPQTLTPCGQSVSQFEGMDDAAILHKTGDTNPKACDLLVTIDTRSKHKEHLIPEYCRPRLVSAIPLSSHLVYTQTVSEHL